MDRIPESPIQTPSRLRQSSQGLFTSQPRSARKDPVYSGSKNLSILFSEPNTSSQLNPNLHPRVAIPEAIMQLHHTPLPFTQIGISRDDYTVELEALLLEKQKHVDTLEKELETMQAFYEQKYQLLLQDTRISERSEHELSTQEVDNLRTELDRLNQINQDLNRQIKEAVEHSEFLQTSWQVQQSIISKLEQDQNSSRDILDLEAQLQEQTKAYQQLQSLFLAYKEISTPLESVSKLLFENDELTSKYSALQQECSDILSEAEKLSDVNQVLSNQNKQLRKEIEQASKEHQGQIAAMKETQEKITMLYYLDTNKLKEQQTELLNIRQLETDLLSNIKSKDNKIHILEDSVERLTAENKALEKKSKENESSKASVEKFHLEISALKSDLNEKSSEIASLERQVQHLEVERSERESEMNQMKVMIDKYFKIKEELCVLYEGQDKLQSEFSTLKSEKTSLEISLKSLEGEKRRLYDKLDMHEKKAIIYSNTQTLQCTIYKLLTGMAKSDPSTAESNINIMEEIRSLHDTIQKLQTEIIDLKAQIRNQDLDQTDTEARIEASIGKYETGDAMDLETIKENDPPQNRLSSRNVGNEGIEESIRNKLPECCS
jgi:predicted  nucleic acid-binding Zn-ribbon protein